MNSSNLKPTLEKRADGLVYIDLQSDNESKKIIEELRKKVGTLLGKNYLEEIIYQIGYGKTIFSDENMKNKQMPIFIKTHLDLTANEEILTLIKIIEGLKSYKIQQYKFYNYCKGIYGLEIEDLKDNINTIELDYFLFFLNQKICEN